MLILNLSLSSSRSVGVPKRPQWLSVPQFKRRPQEYVANLNRKESIDLAKYLDYRYFEKNKPVVSDEHYDILADSIAERWPKAAYNKKVGHKPQQKRKEVALPHKMASLSKLKPESRGLSEFIDAPIVVSEKLDGISLLLEYDKGKLVRCYTRGDGTRGQDVSGVIPALNAPKTISVKQQLLVRCEFLIRGKKFAKHSKEGGGKYETARNMGGGLLTRNEPSAAVKDFDVVAYELAKGRGAGQPLASQLKALRTMGFTVVKHKLYRDLTVERLIKLHDSIRAKSVYALDGIVLSQNVSYRPSARNPEHAKAFKINSIASSSVVEVKDVEWKKSRHDKWIPRVIVDPVRLGGVTVRAFTGHNYFFIKNGFSYKDRRLTMPVRPIGKGAKIRVIRSGDVIPYIMEVVKPARRPSVPTGDYTLDSSGVHAVAPKQTGDKERVQKLVHFFSAMKMKGIKTGVVERLYAGGFKTLRSILHADVESLQVDGIKEKGAQNIHDAIRKSLVDPKFATVAYASSLFGDKIGVSKLQAVIDSVPNIMELTEQLTVRELRDRISEVPGIKTMALPIARGLPRFAKFLSRNKIKLGSEVRPVEGGRLSDVKVLFTSVRDDDLLQEVIEQGGKKAGSVRTATHVVIKEGASNNKIDAALEAGLPVMTVPEFRKRMKL